MFTNVGHDESIDFRYTMNKAALIEEENKNS